MNKKHLYQRIIDTKFNLVDSGWRTFKICFIKNLHYDEEKCDGAVDFDKCEIYLDKALDDERARETFLHELLHIAAETCGFGEDQEFGVKNEELVKRMTRSILSLGNLNPKLFSLIFNE